MKDFINEHYEHIKKFGLVSWAKHRLNGVLAVIGLLFVTAILSVPAVKLVSLLIYPLFWITLSGNADDVWGAAVIAAMAFVYGSIITALIGLASIKME